MRATQPVDGQTLSGRLAEASAWLWWVIGDSVERRARLRTLILIRWIAIIGQAFTIALVHFSLGFPLPLLPLSGAIALSALINVILSLRFATTTRLTERNAALLLAYDALQLSFLLTLTGGVQNPFAILLIVPIALSATIFSLRMTIALCILVISSASLMALLPTALPWNPVGFRLPELYIFAAWCALALGAVLITSFAWRFAHEARRMSEGLAATQMALAREQQRSALGRQAAAAAHELGSPLATIAVTARELANSTPADSPLNQDIAELVSESHRCREILKSISQERNTDDLTPFTRIPLSNLLEALAAPLQRADVTLDVAIEGDPTLEPAMTPTPEIQQALTNLIENAVRFAELEVRIVVALSSDLVVVRIEDDGPGFPTDVLAQLGEPYVSGRQGAGIGLGVFIAQTLLARTGAALQFANHGSGALVAVTWRRASLGPYVPEA